MNLTELEAEHKEKTRRLNCITEEYETCKRRYQEYGVVIECIEAQIENITAGNKLLGNVNNRLINYDVEILKTAKQDTEEYVEILEKIKLEYQNVIEMIQERQRQLNDIAKEIADEAKQLEARLTTLAGLIQNMYELGPVTL